jgi:iron(III) transport system substrate-binding protein
VLTPVDPATLAQVARPYQPSTDRWIGIAGRSTVFVYNKTKPVASALPHSLLDLADPVWRERSADSPGYSVPATRGQVRSVRGKDPAPNGRVKG